LWLDRITTSKAIKEAARRIRLGMVGGGEGAFIGSVHRIAARLEPVTWSGASVATLAM
jgi:hypothetical protein